MAACWRPGADHPDVQADIVRRLCPDLQRSDAGTGGPRHSACVGSPTMRGGHWRSQRSL